MGDTELATDAAIAHANQEAGWPAEQWWRAYGDPQLDGWVQTALDGSPTLAQAEARVRMAMAMAGVAESAESPQIEGEASLVRHRWPNDYFYGPGDLARYHHLEQQRRPGPELHARPLGPRAQQQRARPRPGPDDRRRGTGRPAGAGGQHRPRLHPAVAAIRRAGHRQGHAGTATGHPRPGPASPGRRHRHAFRSQPGGSPAAGDRTPDRSGGRGNPADPQPARRPGRQGPRRRRLDPAPEPEARGAGPEPAQQALPMELLGHRPDVVARRWQVAALAKGVDVARAEFYPNVDLVASVGFSAVGGGMLEFLNAEPNSPTASARPSPCRSSTAAAAARSWARRRRATTRPWRSTTRR